MKIITRKCSYTRKKKEKLKKRINDFIRKEKLEDSLDKLIVDWTSSKSVNTKGGYYGGFISLYENKVAYVNLTVFYELEDLNNLNQVLWAVFHELIHVRQLYTKEIIISEDRESLTYKGVKYNKLNFRGKNFIELYKDSRFRATEYHITEIPWEGECYYKSDLYTGIRSFNHDILDKTL